MGCNLSILVPFKIFKISSKCLRFFFGLDLPLILFNTTNAKEICLILHINFTKYKQSKKALL